MALRVVELEPERDARWERFVASHPRSLPYHQPEYLGALAAEYGQQSLNLACQDSDGRICGVLPLMCTRGLPFKRDSELVGRRLSSLPRTPIAGPLAVDFEATSALLEAAVARARGDRGRRLQLKVSGDLPGAEAHGLAGAPWVPALAVDLPASPDELRFGSSKNHARIRSTVRQASKRGFEVHHAESERELRGWYRLYLETMRWHAVPARPFRFFASLWERLRPSKKIWLLLASRNSGAGRETLAGSFYMSYRDTVYYSFNARTADALRLGCNDAIQWRALHDACADGYRHYDMGEATGGEAGGVGRFKMKWGARSYELQRYHFPPVDQAPTDADPAARVALRDRVTPLWRRIPVGVTGLIGDRVNRYL